MTRANASGAIIGQEYVDFDRRGRRPDEIERRAGRNRVRLSAAGFGCKPRNSSRAKMKWSIGVRDQARSFTAGGDAAVHGLERRECRCSLLILNATCELAAAGSNWPGEPLVDPADDFFDLGIAQPGLRRHFGTLTADGRDQEGFRPVCRAQPPGPSPRRPTARCDVGFSPAFRAEWLAMTLVAPVDE